MSKIERSSVLKTLNLLLEMTLLYFFYESLAWLSFSYSETKVFDPLTFVSLLAFLGFYAFYRLDHGSKRQLITTFVYSITLVAYSAFNLILGFTDLAITQSIMLILVIAIVKTRSWNA